MDETFILDDYPSIKEYKFSELFDLNAIQKLQDLFSAATGVASIITEPKGTPITEPSGFCNLCNEIRKTEKGLKNCQITDSIIGSSNAEGPKIQRCLSGGLLDGGASIVVDGEHIANWLIGQVLDEDFKMEDLVPYADVIGIELDVYINELNKVKRMSKLQFENVCKFLSLNAQQLSNYAIKNMKLTDEINKKIIYEEKIVKSNNELEIRVKQRTAQLEEINAELEESNAMLEETNAELEEINAMLEEEITKRRMAEEEIKKLNAELENKVIQRTNQLQDMNIILEEEIVEKIQAENELNKERELFRTMFEQAPLGIALSDSLTGHNYHVNSRFAEIVCRTEEELKSIDWMSLTHPDDVQENLDNMELLLAGKINGFQMNKRYLRPDASVVWANMTISSILDQEKEHPRHLCMIEDITESKLENERLQKYQVLAERANDAMLFIDQKGNILEVNDAATRIYGYSYTEFSSMNIFDLRHPEKVLGIFEQMELVDSEGIIFETVHYLKNGTPINVEVSSQGTFLGNKRVLLSIIRDITDRKKREDENHYLSYHDVLTGLYNRRFYEEEIKRLDTECNLPISIIIGDVNGLKFVNDAFGHDKGDELLQKATAAIRSACRTEDIVARWGGDEFVILLPKTKTKEAEEIVKRIKKIYSNVFVNSIRVSISFGWDTKSKTDEDILKVLKSAEDYMYKHKIIENEGMRGNTISTIINTLHEKNPREEQHSQRVSEICQNIGSALGFSELKISKLKVVGLLHDIGKIAIEEGILNKPGKLTKQEWDEIKRHPDIGFRILSSSSEMLELADCILAHHERWDGSGYPKGLKGEAIPRVGRIIALADSYDAMTSERSYRKALSDEQAVLEIRKHAGTQFDPEIAKIFVEKVLVKQWG